MKEFSRMERLKHSSDRWILYDLKENSLLGITSFSASSNGNSASEDMPLTKVTKDNRNDFVVKIDGLLPKGGTCLGNGLMKGTTHILRLLYH